MLMSWISHLNAWILFFRYKVSVEQGKHHPPPYLCPFSLYVFPGYDFFTPISEAAKLFCIFYCIVGIPLTLFVLSCLSDFLQPIVTHAPIRHIQTHWAMPYSRAALIHASLLCLVIVTLLFLLPALSFCFLEPEWSFLDALFFCYITLSTIGQGGYMLGRSMDRTARDALKVFTTCKRQLSILKILIILLTFIIVWARSCLFSLLCNLVRRKVRLY